MGSTLNGSELGIRAGFSLLMYKAGSTRNRLAHCGYTDDASEEEEEHDVDHVEHAHGAAITTVF